MREIKVIRDPKAMELLADNTRRKIIDLLRAKDMAVIQIAEHLEKTPQAIYHHIGKMLESGLVEVAKEERIAHFIETYYRATAEFFLFTHGEERDEEGGRLEEARTREAIHALVKLGFQLEADNDTVTKIVRLAKKMDLGKPSHELSEKIAEMNDIDYFTKQYVLDYAGILSMSNKQFEEMQNHQREIRELLMSGHWQKTEPPKHKVAA